MILIIKTKILGTLFLSLIAIFFMQLIVFSYLFSPSKIDIEQKNSFLKLTQLPDLAICTEATFTRHRSLANSFEMHKDDPTLREYFPSTYTYANNVTKEALQ